VTAAAPAPPPLDAGLDQLLRRMRLPHMRRIAPDVIATAKAQRWDPAEVIRALLAEEVAGRDRSSLATRRARAAFPTGKTFDAWDEKLSSVPPPTQAALRTLEWVSRRENLVVCGPSGTGKTFMLEALGQAAVAAGRNVAWFTLEQVGALVRRHRADDSVTKAIARILRADLVVVDDIGLLPVGPDAAEGLYRIVDAAYERRSVAVSSNLHPSKAHMFARTCARRRRNITGSVVPRDGVPARRCVVPGVRCWGMEIPTWRGTRSSRTCSRPRRSLR
jgi:DNA replication protein DnaC